MEEREGTYKAKTKRKRNWFRVGIDVGVWGGVGRDRAKRGQRGRPNALAFHGARKGRARCGRVIIIKASATD